MNKSFINAFILIIIMFLLMKKTRAKKFKVRMFFIIYKICSGGFWLGGFCLGFLSGGFMSGGFLSGDFCPEDTITKVQAIDIRKGTGFDKAQRHITK